MRNYIFLRFVPAKKIFYINKHFSRWIDLFCLQKLNCVYGVAFCNVQCKQKCCIFKCLKQTWKYSAINSKSVANTDNIRVAIKNSGELKLANGKIRSKFDTKDRKHWKMIQKFAALILDEGMQGKGDKNYFGGSWCSFLM